MKWTVEKEEKLHELFFKKSSRDIAEILGFTENAINVKAQRIGLTKKKNFLCYGYISEPELLEILKKKGINLTHDILLTFRRNKLIKSKKKIKKNELNFYPLDTIDYLVDVFKDYELLRRVHKLFSFDNRRVIHGLVRDPAIKIKKIDGYNEILIHKDSIAFLVDLQNNYIFIKDFADLVHYSRFGILAMIYRGFITSKMFRNKHYIHKNYIQKVRGLNKCN